MNEHFQIFNTDSDYVTPPLLHIPNGSRVPELSVHTVCKLLFKQKRTTSGPEGLPSMHLVSKIGWNRARTRMFHS